MISCIYISAVIGAGFATGQEIYSFFSRYGIYGVYGVIISAIIFCIIGTFILKKIFTNDLNSPYDLVNSRYGKWGTGFMKIITVPLQFSVFIVMLSGLKTILCKYGIPDIWGSIIISAGVFLIISSDITKIMKINSVLTPIVIVGISIMCITLIVKTCKEGIVYIHVEQPVYKWVVSALLYGFFNILLALPGLCAAGKILNSSKEASGGGLLGGIMIGAMAFLSNILLISNGNAAENSQMPVIDLAAYHLPYIGGIYQIVIFAAMAGSAVIFGRCTADLLDSPYKQESKNKKIFRYFLLCLVAIPLSSLDFSGLINILYPFFGVVGAVAVLLIVW